MSRIRLRPLLYALLVLGLWLFWAYIGTFWAHVLVRHGGSIWTSVTKDSPRLSPSMRLALSGSTDATAGPYQWKVIKEGFEVTELPVMANQQEVDRIYLARIDPTKFRFAVYNDRTGSSGLSEWMEKLRPALVVNGSYYSHLATPATPFLSNGRQLGPLTYGSKGGVFVSAEDFTGIRDLSHADWLTASAGAHDAMACYPMLIADGKPWPGTPSDWLANRSFVATDGNGRIIIGTTKDGFFSLYRLAQFLHGTSLGLTYALNLDGGPVACQGVSLNGYERTSIGKWELQYSGQSGHLLSYPYGTFEMPIVLAVFPK